LNEGGGTSGVIGSPAAGNIPVCEKEGGGRRLANTRMERKGKNLYASSEKGEGYERWQSRSREGKTATSRKNLLRNRGGEKEKEDLCIDEVKLALNSKREKKNNGRMKKGGGRTRERRGGGAICLEP